MARTRRTSKRGRDDPTQQTRHAVAGCDDTLAAARRERCRAHGAAQFPPHKTNTKATGLTFMTTLLNKTVKREVRIRDQAYIVAISPLTLKLTPKGKRKGLELHWDALVSGDAALAAALNASVGKSSADPARRA